MVRIGSTVIIKGSVLHGIVTGYSENRYGLFKVSVWDAHEKDYRNIDKSPLSLVEYHNPALYPETNKEDFTGADLYRDAAVNLAIETDDREWFDSFGNKIKEG